MVTSAAQAPSQLAYWDAAAQSKTFTHPLDRALLESRVGRDALIVDYGCGYGRLVGALHGAGFTRLLGVDFSPAMVERARRECPGLAFDVVTNAGLSLADASVDAALLFAVLTCVPEDAAQQAIVAELSRVLRPGGILYLSDYPLQPDERSVERYRRFAEHGLAYGCFQTDDGAWVRHHAAEWMDQLFAGFHREAQTSIELVTMNGHRAAGLQAIYRKPA